MSKNQILNFIGKWGRVGGLILVLVPILILTSTSNSRAAPPLPEETDQAEALPPPQGGEVFETVNLPPEAQFVSVDLAASTQVSKHPKLDSALANLAAVSKISTTEAVKVAQSNSLRLSANRVHIQIITHAQGVENAVKAVTTTGGEVTGVSNDGTLIQGWLPLNALETVAAQEDVFYIRRPAEAILLEPLHVGSSTTEALDDMNATAWHTNGHTGAGVKIAIIDGSFAGYTGLLGTDLPTSVTVKNFVDGETDAQVGSGTNKHGVACAEIVHDVAPGAQLYLIKISTALDLQEAVNYSIGQGVDIISTSIVFFNLTPGDGAGFFADLVTQARNAGILWATAAGNSREEHWGGLYSDPNGNNTHNFNSTQEINYFGPGDGNAFNIPSGVLIRVYVRWNDWSHPVDQDYDLALLRWNGSSWQTVATSVNFQNGQVGQTPTEQIFYVTTGSVAPYGFVIVRFSSTQTVNFEMFAPDVARLDELVTARSLANLADAPNAVTVAAVDADPPYPQEPYSSEGPTNGPGGAATGGFIKPDISAYANVSTQSYGAGIFNGTSAATPHVAGAAALVLGANSISTTTQLQAFLEGRAIDLGSPGKDTRFGSGRLHLGLPPPAPPASPDLLIAVAVSQTRINVSWRDNSNNETGFKIERSPNAPTSWTQMAIVGANVTTYPDIGLTPGTTYFYRVRAYNASGHSPYSNIANATTFPGGSVTYTLYLPLIRKDAPPTPTPTPTLPGSKPVDGHWTGITSQSQPMSFDVSSGGTILNNFTLKTTFSVGGCSGTTEVTVSGPGFAITNNQFSHSGGTFSFSGQFNSPTTASGTYSFVNYPGCGGFSQSGTWTANAP